MSLPLRVAVVVSGWGSCSCGKSILAPPYHRTTVPPNSVPSYPHTSVPPRNTIHIPPPYVSAGVRFAPTCRGRPPCLPVFRCFVWVLEMAGRHGGLPLHVAVGVSGWGSGLGLLLLRKEYSRTTVPPNSDHRTPEFRTTDLRLQSYDAKPTQKNATTRKLHFVYTI